MKKLLFLIIFTSIYYIYAQDLSIAPEDLRLEMRAEGGFHLFIRKKPDISSVLLTESTRDPALQADNYAYRAGEWNPINGDEIRYLDGQPIPRESRIYSLISSTVVPHPTLGQAFHIYIPYVLYYGYPEGRHGEVYLIDGTYLNIRAFALPYADYRGAFRDNPFALEARQEPIAGPTVEYMPEALSAFREIAKSGELIQSKGPDDVVELIRQVLLSERGKALDIVICLDTTNSMRKYIDSVRKELIPMMEELLNQSSPLGFPSFRIGMILYKDYYEEYVTRVAPFTSDFDRFQRDLNSIIVRGGGDIPEAVYEALHEGAVKFDWSAESRILLLIGDAPPHPRPRGRITKAMVDAAVEERDIKVYAMILPQ